MGNEKAVEELRGAYKQFLLSDCGRDFLAKITAYELTLTAQAMNESEHQKKAQHIDKASGLYWVRTKLEELSKPPVGLPALKRPRKSL